MDIVMPKMGESVSEGTILKWHKSEGDHVKRDEIVFEISTDKVDTEIPSPVEGILSKIKYKEGDTVEVGTVVAVIDSNDEGSRNGSAGEKTVKEEKPAGKEFPPAEIKAAQEDKASDKEDKFNASKPDEVKDVKPKEKAGAEIEIRMPKMGESVMEGTIIKWHKKAGDPVKKDEVMYEISTDKVDTEVPSPSDGTVSEILVAEQETVEVGTIVAKLLTGEPVEETVQIEKSPGEKERNAADPEPVKEEKPDKQTNIPVKEHTGEDLKRESSKFLSPLVMNIAKKENVSYAELDKIEGTGLDGRVTKKDLLSFIEDRKLKPGIVQKEKEEKKPVHEEKVQAINYEPAYSDGEVEKIPMDNIRQKIMQHMINSRDTSVHVTAMLEADMSKIHNYIRRYREEFLKKESVKLTYLPFIAFAAVKALKEFPLVNSSIEGTTIIRKKFINLGIAVAVEPAGLIVPNIKNADEKNITGLSKSINDLAGRARNKKLTPDDITNGTFTITNYGVFGTVFGTPVINQPEVAILGAGAVIKKPVVVEAGETDTIAIKPVMALTLTHDHRLIDGMIGGKFLKYIKDNLENFDLNLS